MSELRKRNTSGGDAADSSTATTTSAGSTDGTSTKTDGNETTGITTANVKATLEAILVVVLEIIRQLSILYDSSYPVIEKIISTSTEFYKSLAPYHPDLLVPTLVGFVLCFFGGHFVLLIAAVEAYRVCGWDTNRQCLIDLWADFEAVTLASKEDDKVDANNDGIADVKQISGKELLSRKTDLFLKTVEPKRFSESIAGLNAGFVAVVATLKLEFCKVLTLGGSISDAVLPPVIEFLVPIVTSLSRIPSSYHKWIPVVIKYTFKMMIISLVFFMQRIISGLHSSIRGGLMIARNLLDYLRVMKIFDINEEGTYIDEVVGYLLAALGFYFQFSSLFRLPFPINIILFPASMAESFLMWAVSK